MTTSCFRHGSSSNRAFQCQLIGCSAAGGGVSAAWSRLLERSNMSEKRNRFIGFWVELQEENFSGRCFQPTNISTSCFLLISYYYNSRNKWNRVNVVSRQLSRCTWHVQMYSPRLSSVTVTCRSEWCCLVCRWGGCSQLQDRGDSWTHGSSRGRPTETRSSLMDGLQRPGGENSRGDRWE